jgi:murein L,D-transpeptidase YcbB/YkuD
MRDRIVLSSLAVAGAIALVAGVSAVPLAPQDAPVTAGSNGTGCQRVLPSLIAREANGGRPGEAALGQDLTSLYEPDLAPLWAARRGNPAPQTVAALHVLAHASDDGLDSDSYGMPDLQQTLERAWTNGLPVEEGCRLDVRLSRAMLSFFHHLHQGRVPPAAIGKRLASESHDLGEMLKAAIRQGQVAALVDQLRPPLAQYRLVRAELARYRRLASANLPILPANARSIRPGDIYPALPVLRRLLGAIGDLPDEAAVDREPDRYRGALVDAVARFQSRHALEPDGVIGKDTLAALRMPMAHRARQLELALERLRWLPEVGHERLVALNIPMFRLWVWDDIPADGTPLFEMKTIVGRALRTETPVLVADMREVIFRPYWNVPASIARNELVPSFRRRPGQFDTEQMEIVRGDRDDSPTVPFSAAALEEVRSGRLRLRQRPGPNNALGLIKFVFPNNESVYLHGTPAPQLFKLPRRDFSHGCVRVEDPIALAEWVLKETPGWNRTRIETAAGGKATVHVTLAKPIQVVLFYTTAAVMPADGSVHFADDIYRHDARLERTLARH